MTARELSFCHEYVTDFNATAAAKRAGYTGDYIDRAAGVVMSRPHIKYYIQHLCQSKAAKIMTVDPDFVVQKILEVVNKGTVRDGDKLRGLELLARHLGMLRDKTEISGPDGGAIEMEQRTKEDSAAVIAALRNMKKKLRVVGGTEMEGE